MTVLLWTVIRQYVAVTWLSWGTSAMWIVDTLHWWCTLNCLLCADLALRQRRVDCCVWRWWIIRLELLGRLRSEHYLSGWYRNCLHFPWAGTPPSFYCEVCIWLICIYKPNLYICWSWMKLIYCSLMNSRFFLSMFLIIVI